MSGKSAVKVKTGKPAADRPGGGQFSFDLLTNFINPIVAINPDKSIIFANPALEKITGFHSSEFVGIKPPYPWWPEGTTRSYSLILGNHMQRGVHQYEHIFQNKQGEAFWVAITLTPIEYEGKARCFISNWVDITSQVLNNQRITKEHYQKERKLRQNLEREIARRGQFFRMLVHELKTPLTATLFSSELLCEELKEEPYLRLAKNINRAVISLNSRIDELMDLAKGEMGMINLQLSQVDVLAILHEIAEEISIAALLKGKSLKLEAPVSIPLVRCDESRLRQVLQNLLNNAIKFTGDRGNITLRAKVTDSKLIIEVQDTGRGIPEHEQAALFTPYYHAENANDYHSGLGLGLSLSKILVELHGGQIWVDSKLDKGSTFSFSLPLQRRKNNEGQESPK